ncbi:MAG: S1 RNA-binding domain-containing protein [Oscillospiraceae bacterium]
MQPEVGKIYDGKVTGITNFGAFVELEPNVTGMVHISEVANTFVSEIKDHLTIGQEVKVKVLSVSEEGKISLSIKKASENPHPQKDMRRGGYQGSGKGGDRNGRGNDRGNSGRNRPAAQGQPQEKAPLTKEAAFEDMMNKFKQSSDEKMSDIKKNMDSKRRNTSRKRG